MFHIEDLIVYGSNGVCKITDIGYPEGLRDSEKKRYYTLNPLYTTEVIYAPVDTKVFMRPVLTRQEALDLISQIPQIEEESTDPRDRKQVMNRYQASLRSHDCRDLVQLIKTVYLKNQSAMERKRVPGQVDQYFLKRAEDLLYGEFAIALGIARDNVQPFIKDTMESMLCLQQKEA